MFFSTTWSNSCGKIISKQTVEINVLRISVTEKRKENRKYIRYKEHNFIWMAGTYAKLICQSPASSNRTPKIKCAEYKISRLQVLLLLYIYEWSIFHSNWPIRKLYISSSDTSPFLWQLHKWIRNIHKTQFLNHSSTELSSYHFIKNILNKFSSSIPVLLTTQHHSLLSYHIQCMSVCMCE